MGNLVLTMSQHQVLAQLTGPQTNLCQAMAQRLVKSVSDQNLTVSGTQPLTHQSKSKDKVKKSKVDGDNEVNEDSDSELREDLTCSKFVRLIDYI